jgi:DNA (cytosine-5)-methyltransferase 1
MLKVGSDFSGVGAFNQALTRLGVEYQEIFACDMDKYARQTFIHNYGEPKYYPTNVYDREIPLESLDIYMTSPPCQAFSLAGKRLGKDDKRGILFFNSYEFIQKNNPRFFIFENVKGLLSDDGGNTFSEWVNLLGGKSVNGLPILFPYEDSVPYHLYWQVLNAKHHGVPQNRERVFLIGIRDDKDNNFRFPVEEHLSKRLKDVLKEEVNDKYFLSEKMMELITYGKVGNYEIANINKGGQKGSVQSENGKAIGCLSATDYKLPKLIQVKSVQTLDTGCNQGVMVSKEVRTIESKEERKKTGTNNFRGKEIEFREQDFMNTVTTSLTNDHLIKVGDYRKDEGFRWREDGNSPCLHTQLKDIDFNKKRGQSAIYINNEYRIRRLTPRECFRLMDFPDTFTWTVSDSQAYKQAGNSIVVRVLEKIIKNLLQL